jgi:nucleotide-binding universal stress UspA family protein
MKEGTKIMSKAFVQCILVPVDLTSCSRAALEYAYKLAAAQGARVQALFVQPLNGVTRDGAEVAQNVVRAQAELHRFVRSVPGGESVPIGERVDAGSVCEQILENARLIGADMIVLGTHAWTGRVRSLAGSIAESIVRTAPCPVVTVRERSEAFAGAGVA